MVRTTIIAEPDERAIVTTRVFDAPRETWERLAELVEVPEMRKTEEA